MVNYNSLARVIFISSCLSIISKLPLGSLVFVPVVLAFHSHAFEGTGIAIMGDPQHHIYLGGNAEDEPATFNLTISKSQLQDDHVVNLEVDGNITTGHSFMCLDIFKDSDYSASTLETLKDLGNSATREDKIKAVRDGCNKFEISLGQFHTKTSLATPQDEGVIVGSPSRLAAKLVVKPDVQVGKYVLVVGQGSVFRQEPYSNLKQVHVDVIE